MHPWRATRTILSSILSEFPSRMLPLSSVTLSPPAAAGFSQLAGRRNFHSSVSVWEIKKIHELENVAAFLNYKERDMFESGDKGRLPKRDMTEPRLEFRGCKELADADANVRKLCSLEFGHATSMRRLLEHELVSRVQRFESDFDSIEARIAKCTAQIRSMQGHVLNPLAGRKDGFGRSSLTEAVSRRRKYLRRLREWDYNKFCWVLEQLQLEYKPKYVVYRIHPRDIYRTMIQKQAMEIRKSKFEKYHNELKSKQGEFLQRKTRELAAIDTEEKELRDALAALQVEIDENVKSNPSMLVQ